MSTKFVKLIGKNWHNIDGTLNCIVIKLIGCAILSVKIIKEIISFEFSIYFKRLAFIFLFFLSVQKLSKKNISEKKRGKNNIIIGV